MISSVSLCPDTSKPGGKFLVELIEDFETTIIWDRKKEGRFPELKELKVIIRDKLSNDEGGEHSLGHSETGVLEVRLQ